MNYWPLSCKWTKRCWLGFLGRDNDFVYWMAPLQTSLIQCYLQADCLYQLMAICIYKTIVHQSGMNILKAMDKSNCLCQIVCSPHWVYFMILPSVRIHGLPQPAVEGACWILASANRQVSAVLKNPMICGEWHLSRKIVLYLMKLTNNVWNGFIWCLWEN